MASKGIVVRYLCINSSCSFSESKIEKKSALVSTATKSSFKTLSCCPKCKSNIEMIGFVSGSVEIVADDEKTEEN